MAQISVQGRISKVREFERDGRTAYFASVQTQDEHGDQLILPFRSDARFEPVDSATVTLSLSSYQRAKTYTRRDGQVGASIEDVVTFALVNIKKWSGPMDFDLGLFGQFFALGFGTPIIFWLVGRIGGLIIRSI